jgi:hypothetical protein
MPFTPQDFVSKWKRVTAREKQTYQEHFIDLCNQVALLFISRSITLKKR